MSVELLQKLSFGSYLLAGVFIALAAVLYFLLDVPHLFGYVTGRTARKAIQEIENQNAVTGSVGMHGTTRHPSEEETETGKEQSGPLTADKQPLQSTETQVLEKSQSPSAGQTQVLEAETTLLPLNEESAGASPAPAFQIQKELSFTDSHEVIE